MERVHTFKFVENYTPKPPIGMSFAYPIHNEIKVCIICGSLSHHKCFDFQNSKKDIIFQQFCPTASELNKKILDLLYKKFAINLLGQICDKKIACITPKNVISAFKTN